MKDRPNRGAGFLFPFFLPLLLFIFAQGFLRPQPARAQSACTYDLSALTTRVQATVDAKPLEGAALLVAKDGETIYEEAFGAYTTDTIVPIASAGKWLSASVILSLVDSRLLSLDAPVSKFLPNWTGVRGKITIRQLISHTSGLPGITDPQPPCLLDPYTTLAACVDEIAQVPLLAPPGTQFRYGNASFQVAGRIAEIVSGKSWSTLFQERLKGPLGMFVTSFGMTDNPLVAGGALSRMEEYAAFLNMQMNDGMFGSTRVLSAAAIKEMRKNQTSRAAIGYSPSPANPYGLGEFLETWNSRGVATAVSHAGLFGFYPWIDLQRKTYGVFLVYDRLGPIGEPGTVFELVQDLQRMTREAIDAQPCADLDADGLTDIHETGNKTYVSPAETGTSRTRADTDGDGWLDGEEVAAGSNPNKSKSRPPSTPPP